MRVLFYLLTFIMTFGLSSGLFAQTVSNHNGLGDYYPPGPTKPFVEQHDPISEWPDCSQPKDLIISEDRENFQVSWDGDPKEGKKYYYEIQIKDNSNRTNEIITTTKNFHYIPKDQWSRFSKNEIQIRRVCYIGNEKTIYSNWVSQVLAAPCGGGSIANNFSVCSSNTFTIQSSSAGTGGSYLWQYRTGSCSTSGWTDIPNSNTESLSYGPITQTTSFRRYVSCGQYSNCTTVTVNSSPTGTITGINSICPGQSTTWTVSGGTSYLWSHGLGSGATKTISPTSTTTYTVTITSPNGCTAIVNKTMTVNPLPTNIVTTGLSRCGPGVLNINAIADPSGCTFRWYSALVGGTLLFTGTPYSVNVTNSTTFYLEVTTAMGCSSPSRIPVNVTVNPLPGIAIQGPTYLCPNSAAVLSASGGGTYQWSNNTNGSSITVNPSTNTSYTVTVTNSFGCSATAIHSINMNNLTVSSLSPSACNSQNNQYSLSVSINFISPYSGNIDYNDNGIIGSWSVSNVTSTSQTISNLNSNGSQHSLIISIPNCSPISQSYQAPNSCVNCTASITGNTTICQGNSTVLSANQGVSYIWSNGATSQSIDVSPSNSTSYTVTVTHSNNGMCSATANVNVNTPPNAAISGPLTNVCISSLPATLTASGGSSYLWSTNATTSTIIVSPTVATNYFVTVTSSQGCTSVASHLIVPTSCANCQIGISGDTLICSGQSSFLSVTMSNCSNMSLLWSTGATSQSITVSPTAFSYYSVTVTNSNNQQTILGIPVYISNNPVPVITGNTSLCAGQQTTLTASGGQTYQWSNGSVTADMTVVVNTTTTFTVTVTSAAGCQSSESSTVIVDCVQSCVVAAAPPSLSQCSNSLFTITGNGSVNNPTSSFVNIQIGSVTLSENINPVDGTFAYTIPDLDANGLQQTVNISISDCDTISHTFLAPQSCMPTGSFTYMLSSCDPVSNSFSLIINLTVSNPVHGQVVTFTEGGTSFGSIVLSSQNNYTYTFDNIIANGDLSDILMEAPWGNFTETYVRSAACLPSICNIFEVELVASECNKTTQKFGIEGVFRIEHPVDYGTFFISLVGSNAPVQIINSTGAFEYSFTFENITANGTEYTVNVTHTSICGTASGKIKSSSGCSDLPDYLCGISTGAPPSTSTTPLSTASAGDVFIVAGMAFRCDTITGSNGLFSGVGSLSIPFSSKKLKVQFNNISVNNEYYVTAGTVFGVRAQPSENFNIPQEPINLGGDICVVETAPEGIDNDGFDKQTGLNDRGFGMDGKFQPGGTTYDPNGYDYQGNHKDTEGPYDTYGCDVEGLTVDKKPCERDTLDKMKRDSIIGSVQDSLSKWFGNASNDIQKKLNALKCDSLSSRINALITTLEYTNQSQYIIGSSGQYLNKGMHKNFASEPKLLLNNSGRDENAIDLEKTHVELYKCDLFRDKFERALEQLSGVDPEKFKSYIIKEVRKLSKDQVDAILADSNVMMEWVLAKLVEYAQNPDAYGYILHPDLHKTKSIELPKSKSKSSAYFSMASIDDYTFTPKEGEEEKWLFNQGFKEINGINRGIYLESLYDQMQQDAAYGGGSSGIDNILMPIPLIKDVEGLPYKIFLDNIELTANTAKLDAFFVFQDPSSQNGQKFVMVGENIHFGPGGLIGETKLKLKNPIDLRLSNAVMLHLLPAPTSGNGGCYVSWDCEGFKSLNIQGKIELCRNFIVPLDPVTKDTIPAPTRYSFDFDLNVRGWHDIYLEINNTNSKPFAIAGYTDFKWTVSGVVIDNSDFQSPKGISFIEGYTSEHLTGNGATAALDNSWRGVAMKTLTVTLPPVFNNNGSPVTTGVQSLLIDDNGASGRIFATPLIPYETGNLAGWQFSLDTLKIEILKNHINGGGLAGKIRVPVLKNPTRYSAMIYKGGKFQFSISPSENEKMDFLLADVTLKKNSIISVTVSNGDADIYAELHGTIDMQSEKLKIPKITFENFKIGNKDPYFNAGTWKVANNITAKLFGFKLNVSNIKPFSPEYKKAGVTFDISVELPKDIKAGGGLEVIGKMETDYLGRQNWVYETTRVNKFLVDAKIAAGHLYGFLESFDETTSDGYGKGFHGMIEMDFTGLAKVQAVALFATKNEDKFFFVDAAVTLPTGIPVGPFAITGFAGGASYMMQETFTDNDPPEVSKTTLPKPGTSLSGTKYVYNSAIGLGLKAGITFGLTSSQEAFNGSLIFGIQFNTDAQGGGVANISMDGKGQFMMKAKITGPKIEPSESSEPLGVPGKIKAHVRFVYDFNNKEFTGRMAAFVRAPGIIGQGKVDVLASKSSWYLYIGTPDKPIFLDFSLPPFGSVRGETYLNIGSIVPDMKPIPAHIRAVAYKVKQSSLRASGGGFVFGVSLKTKMIADAKIATAELNAEIGFDVMLRNFGNASCAASPGEKIGINGWYAMGQIYAFMEGKLKILGVNIFSAALAGVLQAELPNPFFGQATLGVKIKTFLGSYDKSIALILGTRCQIAGDSNASPLGMNVIAAINPADKAEKMETDFVPGATFNLPMNTKVEMGQDTWKPSLKKYSLTSLKNGHVYTIDSIFSDDRASFLAKPKTMFFAGDSIRFEVEVMVTKTGSNPIYESKSSIFTVGGGYTNIPKANIESSYPIDGMKNYYRMENINNTGFVQLQQGMPELFYNIPAGMSQKLRISPKNGEPFYIDYTYNGLNARINFDMKPEWFSNGQEYKIELIRLGTPISTTPSSGGQTAGQQGGNINLGSAIGNPGAPPFSANSEESVELPAESVLLSLGFKTSIYNKFVDKMNTGIYTTHNTTPAFKVSNEIFDNIEANDLIELKIHDPNQWMITEAYNKIFTVNIDLTTFGCGIVSIEDGQQKFDDLNNEIYLASKNNNGFIINNVYNKALQYYENLKWSVNGCDVGDLNISTNGLNDASLEIWLLNNFPLNQPTPPLTTIVTYTIPGIGTTSTYPLSF